MCRTERISSLLYDLASSSSRHCNFKHSAAITNGSKVLSTGVNDGSRTKWGKTIKCCLHAEINALNNLKSKSSKYAFTKPHIRKNRLRNPYRNLILWVVCIHRTTKSPHLFRESRPCRECIEVLYEHGIRRIAHSTSDGQIVFLKIDESFSISEFYKTPAQTIFHQKDLKYRVL